MAVRIPVVISQSVRRAGAVAEYEQDLVTRLIFENGLDATLVADLQSIQVDTTDHLCIEGLKGDFALASWEPPEYACTHLHRLGIESLVLVPINGGPRLESVRDGMSPKKIFFILLSTNESIDETIKSLQELRNARAIPVVSLGLASNRSVSAIRPQAKMDVVKPQEVEKASEVPSKVLLPSTLPAINPIVLEMGDVDAFPNIDELMNDLDKFEL
jgi:hypothetical protein